jgi:integrase
MARRAKKGTISVENREGMLRLRLPRSWYKDQKNVVYFSLGIPDTPENRLIANAKKGIMESDYIYQRFDFSLNKYRFDIAPKNDDLSLLDIFIKYLDFKSRVLKHSSLKDLQLTLRRIKSMPKEILSSAEKIKLWLIENTTQDQSRRILMQISACCDWGIEQKFIENNPFKKLKKFKKISRDFPQAFTLKERDLIIQAFEVKYPAFADFVKFLFFTGCRPSEAIGLKWANVNLEERYLIIREVYVDNFWEKSTKTNQSRKFPINEQLYLIFKNIEHKQSKYDTVFVSPKGLPLNLHNFTNKNWTPLIKELGLQPRGCYHCRHTFISLCLYAHIPVQQVAKWVGSSSQTILAYYAAIFGTEIPNL